MPLYTFRCDQGHDFDVFGHMADPPQTAACPLCQGPGQRVFLPPAGRVFQEQYSEALGVGPGQVDAARRQFPHHRFTPDGRMIISSASEKRQVLKDLGYADFGDYHRDKKDHAKLTPGWGE